MRVLIIAVTVLLATSHAALAIDPVLLCAYDLHGRESLLHVTVTQSKVLWSTTAGAYYEGAIVGSPNNQTLTAVSPPATGVSGSLFYLIPGGADNKGEFMWVVAKIGNAIAAYQGECSRIN